MLFRSNDTATTEIYTGWYTLSLHDALPISVVTEELSPGQSVPITFIRAGRRHRVTVKLAERPASPG